MLFSYNFPAVRGIQAGREYFISMVPLKLLGRLFPPEDDIVMPEYRAQRRINEARIPEIRDYILSNRNSYVFSALSASIDGDFIFESSIQPDIGVLKIAMDATFLINDGQHRKAAIEAAMEEDESLTTETISIVFFRDEGLQRSQQMFTDLNKHAVKTSNSLATLYDACDQIGVATKSVIDAVPFFKRYTDKERDILGKNSSKLFTLNTIYKANQRIIKGTQCNSTDTAFLIRYWTTVASNITEWQDILSKSLTKKSIRENYIITLAITISALGRLGHYYYEHCPELNDTQLAHLATVDWSRTNPDWVGRAIRPNGKVLNSEEATILICSKIKQVIGIALSKDEEQREIVLMERSK